MIKADITAVALMELAIFSDPWPESAFFEILDNPDQHCLIAEYESTITGYGIYFYETGEAHLANIAVDPDFRGKSIAKKLLNRILEVTRETGCRNIFLDVRQSNLTAINFYRKSGFTEIYRREKYYQTPVEDAIVMVKSL
jgi:ribosomal-protein-alanine N-acetyltransferase